MSLKTLLRAATAVLVLASLAASLGGLSPWLDLVDHFRLQLTAAALLLALLLLALGDRPALAGAVGALVLNGAIVAPYVRLPSPTAEASAGRQVTVISYNLRYDNRELYRVADWLAHQPADFVLLQEVTPQHRAALRRLAPVYPTQIDCAAARRCRVMLLSRHVAEQVRADQIEDRLPWVEGRFVIGGKSVTLVGTHLARPFPGSELALRDAQHPLLAKGLSALPDRAIVAGDFNSTPWNGFFETLLADTGFRHWRNFNLSFPSWLSGFGIPIDHVLTRGEVTVRDLHLGPDLGSDHLPVVAALTLP